MFNFFDHIICLTQKERKDRQLDFERECIKHRINGSYYYAEPSDLADGARFDSFCKSQIGMLKRFSESKAQTGLMLEDDVQFYNINNLQKALYQLPLDWDILYLGANIIGVDVNRLPKPEQYSEHLFRVKAAWTTHAIAYNGDVVEKILSKYKGWQESGMYDDWLSREILPNVKAFIIYPMVAVQRPVKSDLWGGRHVDYTGCFEQGNRLMYDISLKNQPSEVKE